MAKRRSGSTNYRNRKTTKSKGPIESLFSMAKDVYKSSPISQLLGKDSKFRIGGNSKGAKFTPAATAQRKKNMKVAMQRRGKNPEYQQLMSDAASSVLDIGGMAKITKITNLAGKSVKVKQGDPLRKIKARTDKNKLKIAKENKEARAPAIAESKKYRESFGSHRVVEPTRKDYLFPAKTYEDHKYAKPTKDMPNPIASRVDNEMSIMSGTDKTAIDRIKKGKENRAFLDEGHKIEYVGPGQRDMGDGKKQNWVSGTDVDVARNKAFQTGDEKDFNRLVKVAEKRKDQLHDYHKDINPNMVHHHTEVVKQTREAPIGKKTVSRVYIAKEPPELEAFGKGKEQDIAGLKKDLGKATQHGNMESFTEEELAHRTTQKFLKVTRDYGKKQARNKKLSTGELDDGSRAWPEGAKVSDITGEKGKAFRASEKLKIEKKEAKKRKTAETIARKKVEEGDHQAWLEEGQEIQFRKELATKIKAEPNKKKRKKMLKIATGRTPGVQQKKKNSDEIPF